MVSEVGSGSNAGSFYGQEESNTSIVPSSPKARSTPRLMSLSLKKQSFKKSSSTQSTLALTQQQPASQSRSEDPDWVSDQADKDPEACSLPPRRRSTRKSARRQGGGEKANVR